ncbi:MULTISPECIES: potassium channel family protein [unclassified Microbacterium]|uniref:potassium channel family protein n=1 Tax=unclassified Microbacterium TaxID=2609290 RepID=UPI00097C6D17|nr:MULTISPECIES: TrkA family potassium uptake protein [unclassified Microbacterium]MDI9892542.1 TrkA family potassium uptake protein [Microbacterium sp. IEGM 1404]MXS75685.1 TrkA family potassium uptake protein [Microbacterium sp. TL13]ONI64779.1 potassium transporter [Microbacterium sp. CSI-V]
MDNAAPFFRRRRARENASAVAVIGLGRFGGALAVELARSGTEVLGIDTDEDIVQSLNGVLTHVVRADSTKQGALEQLGVVDFDRVVVGIGSDIQASILTTSLLKRMGVRSIWAKAISEQHGLILEQLGIEHVIFPEADMGRRVAHLVRGSMLDYVEFDTDLVVAKTVAPQEMVGLTLEEAAVRRRHGVTVVKIKGADGEWHAAGGSSVVEAGNLLIVIGPVERTERFAALL